MANSAAGGGVMSENEQPEGITRRHLVKVGAAGALGLAATRGAMAIQVPGATESAGPSHLHMMGTGGDVDIKTFDPSRFVTTFDWGKLSQSEDGRPLREYDL